MSDASSDDTLTAVAAIQRELPPGWRPFMREADLTRTALATGLNALAKANHMQGGFYNQAFFNISIGLERLLKRTRISGSTSGKIGLRTRSWHPRTLRRAFMDRPPLTFEPAAARLHCRVGSRASSN